jgi:uncharacterized peroxidase-related enzyme
MPFFKSHNDKASPGVLFAAHPDLYLPWSEMSELLMNGPSPLSQGEREMILAYAAAVADCHFVYIAHSAVAYAWGIEPGLIEKLIEDPETAPISAKLKPLMAFVRKLAVTPSKMVQADADAVFDAGWDETALHYAIAITARAAFMQRIVQGHGFIPMTRERSLERAQERKELGYINLFPQFRDAKKK